MIMKGGGTRRLLRAILSYSQSHRRSVAPNTRGSTDERSAPHLDFTCVCTDTKRTAREQADDNHLLADEGGSEAYRSSRSHGDIWSWLSTQAPGLDRW